MPHDGFTLVEMVFVVALITTMTAAAVPSVSTAVDSYRTVGAVRYVATRLQRARADAVLRGANAALRISGTAAPYTFSVYVDGNGDGVRSADIDHGIDRRVIGPERLSNHFTGVEFGTLPGLPPVDSSSSAPGADPIRLGSARMASFTPVGTSTSGSLYILGPHHTQYVVRLYGETGKTRILKFNARTGVWDPL